MGRKKPPGAKRKTPTSRVTFGSAGDFLKRLNEAHVICECSEESGFEVLQFCRDYLNDGTWDPPLPEDFSLFMSGSSWNEGRELISIRGVSELTAWGIKKAVEDHPKYHQWECFTE